ncbi:MAG: glycosyltransferase [Flavobacteriia bacterium]|jgi:glycosyltransferase involved in cell wall biosynthesis
MKTEFSIILPTYNRAHRINRAIESILEQRYSAWELIIVDDASTDNTEELIQPYLSDSRIRYIKNEINQERCVSRNIGIEAAKGDYICFLDSDDYHLPHHLESFDNFLKANNFPKAFLFSNSFNETENGERSARVCPPFDSVDRFTYFLRYTVNPQRWCVHRNILLEQPFDPNVTICEDMDTSLRIAAAGFPIHQIDDRTTVYVAASDSFTHGDHKKWEKELFYLKRIFAKPILKTHLPGKEKRRLLSMCYFHLGQVASFRGEKLNAFTNTFLSIFFYPKGYKSGLAKINIVALAYNLPLIGKCIRTLFQKKKYISVQLPVNVDLEHHSHMEKFSSYHIREEKLVYKKNALVTPEGLIGKYGILHRYSAFNLRGHNDKNFYVSFARLFLEQTLVSLKGKSLKRHKILSKSLVIHTKWFNYGFWLNSALVRLLIAEKAGILKDVKLIYPSNWKTIPYVNESLKLFPELKINEVPNDVLYVCEELYFPEVRQYTGSLNPDHIRLIRDEIPKKLGTILEKPFRKVYVTRRKRGVRMPENEVEVISFLMEKGFETIDFDELAFKDQVKLMTETKFLISIHGAGMGNINFMQKGTSVLELINEPYAKAEYTFPFWKLGTLNELNYQVLFCPAVDDSITALIGIQGSNLKETDFLVNQNILVDLKKLESLL